MVEQTPLEKFGGVSETGNLIESTSKGEVAIGDIKTPKKTQNTGISYDFAGFICMMGYLIGSSLGLIGGNYSGENRIKKTHVPRNQAAIMRNIDRDELSDLVRPNGKILLADQTKEGISYRPLTSSDRYRIQ